MFINKKTGASYGLVAPEISEDAGKDIKMPFPTFGSVEAQKVEDHLEVKVDRTHTVVTFGEIDELPVVDLKTSMIGEIPIINLVAKPNADLPDGIRLTVLLDPNSDLYPKTVVKGINDGEAEEESEEESEEKPEEKESKIKLGLVALVLSASDEPEAPAFVCVIPSVASFLSETLNKLMGDDSEVDFRGNPVPVSFTLVSGQWVPADTIVGLASVQTTVDGVSELVDRIPDAIANNDNSGEDDPNNGGDDNGTTGNEGGDDNGTTGNEGGEDNGTTGNEGGDDNGTTDNEGGGNDDPTGNKGGDNDDPNNGGDH